MKFSHIADCHIGGWSEPKMKQLTIDGFNMTINAAFLKALHHMHR